MRASRRYDQRTRQQMTVADESNGEGVGPPTGDPAEPGEGSTRTPLARVMASPFVGFVPWIALGVLEGPGRLVTAGAVALAISVALVVLDRVMGRSVKILAVVDVVSFAVFLATALLATPARRQWMETWLGELANLILVLIVACSMIARVPFTIQYAKEETPPEYWDTPVFLRINYVISAVWGLAFLVASAAGFYGDAVLHNNNDLWTGWIIQVAASLVAIQFTNWYPDYASARAVNAGASTDPPPPVAALLAPLLTYLVPVGIIVLVFGAGPLWLGSGLIIVGAAGGAALRSGRARNRRGRTTAELDGAAVGTRAGDALVTDRRGEQRAG